MRPPARQPAFQWWMSANLAVGAGFAAFVALLIPPFVTEATGNPAEAGVVMSVISLAAILGPALGSFADRYRAHRLVLNLGVLGMGVAFAMYALSSGEAIITALDAIVMGASIAAVSAVGPVFIVGTGLPRALEAKRMTVFSLLYPAGQVVGGALLGMAATAGWSYERRFWLGAGLMLVLFAVTWATSAAPAARIRAAEADDGGEAERASGGLRAVVLSAFGLYLFILVLSSTANNGVNNQIANILPNVYGIDETATSGLISLAGLLNIVLFFPAGAWMSRSGAMGPFLAGNVARLAGAGGMAVLGLAADAPVLLVAASMQVLYAGSPFVRLSQPSLAIRFATFPAGAANGWVIGASAAGSFVGSLLGGWLAESVGYNAINWMAAVAAGLATAMVVLSLRQAYRARSEEPSSSR